MAVMVWIIAVLSAALLISLFRLILVKRGIRSVKKQLQERADGVERPVDLTLIDRDLTELAAEINISQAAQKEAGLSVIKSEHHLKETIANISHDLRTPLTSMTGYLQLLAKTELTGEQREYLEISLQRGKDLQLLIHDFYDISVLESKDSVPLFSRIHLDNLLAEQILSFASQFEEKGIIPQLVCPDMPTCVWADETMLKRIFTNLISNAVRYGRRELHVTILNLDYVEVRVQNIVTNLSDMGNAIDPERIFNRFYMADSSRSQSGSGLGLYIVRKLTELNGGTVSAELNDTRLTICLRLIKA